ncbi:MAG: alpha/beta hydrolase [Woeseia sp.]
MVLVACDALRPVEIPIPTRFHDGGIGQTKELVIFLPGLGDGIEAFERAGFIDQLRRSRRPLDSVSVDAHFGYYINGSISRRVYEDVLLPYGDCGYSRFILVGTSLGGLGAIGLNHDYSDRIAGMVLLAPFLGDGSLIQEIEQAGGVRNWKQQLDYDPEREGKAWLWLEDMVDADTGTIPAAIIAYGAKDKFEPAGALLARSIPPNMVFLNNGSHDWKTWAALWTSILESDGWERFGETVRDEIGSSSIEPNPDTLTPLTKRCKR